METHPRGYLYPRGCRPRYPQHIFRSLRTIRNDHARYCLDCLPVVIALVVRLEKPNFWSCLIHHTFILFFHSRELSAVFTSSSRPPGDPALVIPFQPASRPFILFSPFTVSGTTLDWFCVQQCSWRHIPFIFTSFFSIPGVQLFVRRFVFSNHASLEQARVKCRYSRSDELGYQPSQLQ